MMINTKKTILDACCGGKMFWFNKNNPNVLFIDNRYCEKGHNHYRKNHCVIPDILMDFRDLKFPNNRFNLVVFDPPHLKLKDDVTNVAKLYGRLNPDTWKDDLKQGFKECMRVLKPEGFLIFKWYETSIKIKDILELFEKVPLFGNKQGTKLKTHWLVYMKTKELSQNE